VHEDGCRAVAEEFENGVKGAVAEVSAVGVSIEANSVEVEDVETMLFGFLVGFLGEMVVNKYLDFYNSRLHVWEWEDTHRA